MPKSLPDLAQALLDAARRAGAEAADVVAVEGSWLSADVLNGRLEHAERAEGGELGLRVLVGKRQACVASSDTRPEALAAMCDRAVAMARAAPEDPTAGLADPFELAGVRDAAALDLADPAPEPDPAELEDHARRAEAAALAVAGVTRTEAATAGYGRRTYHLAATNGFSGGLTRTERHLAAAAIVGQGTAMERDWFGETRTYQAELPSPEEVGRLAAERALAREGARRPPTGPVPVLFDERVAASLIGHLLSAINGAAVARGASWLADAMGQPVLPAELSLVEDPLRPRGPASRPFDAEGLPTRRRTLVEDGVLASWVLDLGTARRLGLTSTGNAARAPSGPPSPSVSNVALTQGSASREDLIAEMGRGLLVTSLLGATVNPTTGDYSRGASGHWVEGGRIAYPVNECTIAGNLREMLPTLVAGNDARLHVARVVPSLLVGGLTVAGA